jgi:hypothetical protein
VPHRLRCLPANATVLAAEIDQCGSSLDIIDIRASSAKSEKQHKHLSDIIEAKMPLSGGALRLIIRGNDEFYL